MNSIRKWILVVSALCFFAVMAMIFGTFSTLWWWCRWPGYEAPIKLGDTHAITLWAPLFLSVPYLYRVFFGRRTPV